MRLLFIQKRAGTGGSKTSLLETLRCAREQPEIQCQVIVGEAGPFLENCRSLGLDPVIGSLPEWRKPFQRLWFSRRIGQLAEKFRSFAPDYVISNEMWWAPHAVHLAKELNSKSAAFIRDTLAAGKKTEQYLLPTLDRVLCVSRALEANLTGATSSHLNTRVVYNAITPPVARDGAVAATRALIRPFSPVQRWLLTIGRVGARKNQIEAVRALAFLHENGRRDWGLLLAGEVDPAYAPLIQQEIARARLQSFVCLAGHSADIGNLVELSELTLLTSKREGLPRSIVESFLAGKPCFSTPVAGLTEIYGEQRDPFVSSDFQGAAVGRKILAALESEIALHRATHAVQQQLQKTFSPDCHLQQLLTALG